MSVYIHMSVCIDICITSYDKMCVYTYIFTHITSNDDSPIIKQTNKQTNKMYLPVLYLQGVLNIFILGNRCVYVRYAVPRMPCLSC